MFRSMLLGLMVIPLVGGQPYPIPLTCYSKVLGMGKEITKRAAEIKSDPETRYCVAHFPDLNIDVHNACVIPTMVSYASRLHSLRGRGCGYTKEVQKLRSMILQLHMIILQKCHGELLFTYDDCAMLHRRSHRNWTGRLVLD